MRGKEERMKVRRRDDELAMVTILCDMLQCDALPDKITKTYNTIDKMPASIVL